MYIQLSPDHPVGPIMIADCRNAVIIGGSIRALPSAKVNGADQRAIYVRNCTGTVHIEGVHIDGAVSGAQTDGIAANSPKAVLQIQNVRVDGLRGGSTGNHSDVFQPWGGLLEYRIDRLTGSSNFQGLHVFENTGPIGRGTIRNTNIVGTNDGTVDKGGYYLWTDCDDNYPLQLDGVYVAPPARPALRPERLAIGDPQGVPGEGRQRGGDLADGQLDHRWRQRGSPGLGGLRFGRLGGPELHLARLPLTSGQYSSSRRQRPIPCRREAAPSASSPELRRRGTRPLCRPWRTRRRESGASDPTRSAL
ncbi:hypothetical protein A7K94_0200730 [Modestobacter sp. VKM Ac-2676]|nr:hypothetical protein A7K94_0200730 [Modestobacter sp. VKM Ac-2676]